MKTLLYADHLFFLGGGGILIMFPGKSLRDSGMPFYWQHDPNTAIIAQVWNRREERQWEAMKKKQYSVMWSRVDTFGKSSKLTAVAPDQRIFQMNQALDDHITQ